MLFNENYFTEIILQLHFSKNFFSKNLSYNTMDLPLIVKYAPCTSKGEAIVVHTNRMFVCTKKIVIEIMIHYSITNVLHAIMER